MSRSSLALAAALALLFLGVTGCSDDPTRSPDRATSADPATAAGPLTVFSAASLTEAFTDVRASLSTSDPDLTIRFSFAGSGALVAQIQQGAPADVVATADTASMQQLVDAGLVETPEVFARNELQILVAPGNPLGIGSLADLARDGVKLVLGDETVPVGRYAAEALTAAGVIASPVSRELDVKALVGKVTSGEADAAIVYVTNVAAAGAKGRGITIPQGSNVVAQYPIAVVKGSRRRAAAVLFVADIVQGVGQEALADRGFLPAA